MELRDHDLQRFSEADRREVDPPVQVQMATWSKAGQLDWWVKSGSSGWVAYGVLTASSGGSKLLIFVPRAANKTSSRPR